MEVKIQKVLKINDVDEETAKAIQHLMYMLPEDASEDEIRSVANTVDAPYRELLFINADENGEEEVIDDDDFEDAFLTKAKKTIDFLLQKEKDLLLASKPKNKSILQKALFALNKEAEKLLIWEQKESTLEAYKTALSDLYDVENPEEYFTKKNNLLSEYIVIVNKQVDDYVPKWKGILSLHRLTAQKLINDLA